MGLGSRFPAGTWGLRKKRQVWRASPCSGGLGGGCSGEAWRGVSPGVPRAPPTPRAWVTGLAPRSTPLASPSSVYTLLGLLSSGPSLPAHSQAPSSWATGRCPSGLPSSTLPFGPGVLSEPPVLYPLLAQSPGNAILTGQLCPACGVPQTSPAGHPPGRSPSRRCSSKGPSLSGHQECSMSCRAC